MQAQETNDSSSGEQGTVGGNTGGWDPYEVWRTRVLLPRLKQLEANAPDAARSEMAAGRLRLASGRLDRPIILTGPRALPR
jgi:hypothetical protein